MFHYVTFFRVDINLNSLPRFTVLTDHVRYVFLFCEIWKSLDYIIMYNKFHLNLCSTYDLSINSDGRWWWRRNYYNTRSNISIDDHFRRPVTPDTTTEGIINMTNWTVTDSKSFSKSNRVYTIQPTSLRTTLSDISINGSSHNIHMFSSHAIHIA